MTERQVDKSHYDFHTYMQKRRWISIWYQVHETLKSNGKRILEVGPGAGVFKVVACQFGLNVETLDLDPDLGPDHIGSVTNMQFADGSYDVSCAFQVLEHLPYANALAAFSELRRVCSKKIIISLPDVSKSISVSLEAPKIGRKEFLYSIPNPRPSAHLFDGQHHWEIGKKGYSLKGVLADLSHLANLEYSYRVPDNPYHRIFVFRK